MKFSNGRPVTPRDYPLWVDLDRVARRPTFVEMPQQFLDRDWCYSCGKLTNQQTQSGRRCLNVSCCEFKIWKRQRAAAINKINSPTGDKN